MGEEDTINNRMVEPLSGAPAENLEGNAKLSFLDFADANPGALLSSRKVGFGELQDSLVIPTTISVAQVRPADLAKNTDVVHTTPESVERVARFEALINDINLERTDSNGLPKDRSIGERLKEFARREDITAEDKVLIFDALTRIANGVGVTADGIQDRNTRLALVSGLLDNLAQPGKIDQSGTRTCTTTALQEQLYKYEPLATVRKAEQMYNTGRYLAPVVDGNGVATNSVFEAQIPPSFINGALRELVEKNQTRANSLNAATLFQSVGMVNHFWQQKGRFYSVTQFQPDGSGEFTGVFNQALSGEQRFTDEVIRRGSPSIAGPYETADMGVAAGLKGSFLLSYSDYLSERNHAGIARIEGAEDIDKALDKLGRKSAITMIDAKRLDPNVNQWHVVSLEKSRLPGSSGYRFSDQNGNSILEGKIMNADQTLSFLKLDTRWRRFLRIFE